MKGKRCLPCYKNNKGERCSPLLFFNPDDLLQPRCAARTGFERSEASRGERFARRRLGEVAPATGDFKDLAVARNHEVTDHLRVRVGIEKPLFELQMRRIGEER